MKTIYKMSSDVAREHFLKCSSYCNIDFPRYIKFDEVLQKTQYFMGNEKYKSFMAPKKIQNEDFVNYKLISNKDGKFSWRPLEIIHPVIYVSLINTICDKKNWSIIHDRFSDFEKNLIQCCSHIVISTDQQSDKATQIHHWWTNFEQESLKKSLSFSHVLHTDVSNCYACLYTHSIPWAIHGKNVAKSHRKNNFFGNEIDKTIQDSRYGQTNGIPQGSVLMDFIAEIVLGYVDELFTHDIKSNSTIDEDEFYILRYRDDYRIFTNNDSSSEKILKILSDNLRKVGMSLGASKTFISHNIVESSIKADKLAAMNLQDLGGSNAKTLQKKILIIHSFGRKYPNSGALKVLLDKFYNDHLLKYKKNYGDYNDTEVIIAILVDILHESPSSIQIIMAIVTHMLHDLNKDLKKNLWEKILNKVNLIPNNGYLEIWLQRVTKPISINITFDAKEKICKLANGEKCNIWNNSWISHKNLKKTLESAKIIQYDPSTEPEKMLSEEFKLFRRNMLNY